jgi:CDGSH-type Zn-finger protein
VNDRQATITPYRNGPYLVRGPFTPVDQDGNEIDVKRQVVALCRCGRSQIRPFCDGTHKTTRFRAESGPASSNGNGAAPSLEAPTGDSSPRRSE